MSLLPLSLLDLLPLERLRARSLLHLVRRQHDLLALLYLIETERAIVCHLLKLAVVLYEELLVAGEELQLSFYLALQLADQHFWVDFENFEHPPAEAELLKIVNFNSHVFNKFE